MNKHTAAFCAALMSACISASVFAYDFKEFKSAPAEVLNIPVRPDSTQKENPFKPESLLNSRDNLNPYAAAGWTTLVPGPDGKLHLAGEEGRPVLHTLYTRMRTPGYAGGKLVLHSTSRARVKVNGETKITKTSADSVASDADARLTLKPEQDYDIIIDIISLPDDPASPEFSMEFVADADYADMEIEASPVLKKRVSVETAIGGERVIGSMLSSNGRYLIIKSRETVSDKETLFRTILMETATGAILNEALSADAQWITGECAYTTAVARKGLYDVYRTEVPSMRTSLLAKGLPSKNFTITPGGRYILYNKEVDGVEQSGIMHRYTSPDDRIPGDRDRSYLMRYDLKTQVNVPLTYGGASTDILSITYSGDKLVYSSSRQTPDRFPFYSTDLIELDLNSLRTDTLVRNMVQSLAGASYSPDGRQLFITAGPDAFGGIGANYAPHEMGNDFDSQGYIFDIATRKARAMTRDFNPTVKYAKWNHADGLIYILGEEGFGRNIYQLDPKSGRFTRIQADVPYVRSITMSADNSEWMSYTGGSFTSDGEAFVRNMKNGKTRRVYAPLDEWTGDVEFGEMRPWNFTASDGTEIDGWMCLPPGFDESGKYPLIVYYYGGTSPSYAGFSHLYSPQVFASRDYVVYVLNPSGTTGYGQEFSARHVNAWGKRTAEDIIEGTTKFCREHPFIDKDKIGCIGASYGGFMTQYLQTLTDLFAAAVSHAGISNVTSYWGEGYWGYSYNSVAAAKNYPWNNPDLFTKQGSLFNADKIHTPLLLLHGTDDTNVPVGESIQLFNALKILGRDVEFITVEDENHVISGYESRKIWQDTIMAWFAKYLKDEPAWWDSMYEK